MQTITVTYSLNQDEIKRLKKSQKNIKSKA